MGSVLISDQMCFNFRVKPLFNVVLVWKTLGKVIELEREKKKKKLCSTLRADDMIREVVDIMNFQFHFFFGYIFRGLGIEGMIYYIF